MPDRIGIIQGHPHDNPGHFCHALAEAYANGASETGATVKQVDVARIAPKCLSDPADFSTPPDDPQMVAAREAIPGSDHLVIVFPLWLGTIPAMLNAFFEHMYRAGFAIEDTNEYEWPKAQLQGRSARVIVTMGMPAIAYRLWFLNAGVSNLKRLILGLPGIGPVRQTTIGGIGALDPAGRDRWLARIKDLGRSHR